MSTGALCICKHRKSAHCNINGFPDLCIDCYEIFGNAHPFHLDNLSYIEELAKAKGLV